MPTLASGSGRTKGLVATSASGSGGILPRSRLLPDCLCALRIDSPNNGVHNRLL